MQQRLSETLRFGIFVLLEIGISMLSKFLLSTMLLTSDLSRHAVMNWLL